MNDFQANKIISIVALSIERVNLLSVCKRKGSSCSSIIHNPDKKVRWIGRHRPVPSGELLTLESLLLLALLGFLSNSLYNPVVMNLSLTLQTLLGAIICWLSYGSVDHRVNEL